jgi:RNA recognition motif-containing protein
LPGVKESAAEALNGTIMDGKTLTVNINEEPVVKSRHFSAATSYHQTSEYRNLEKLNTEVKKKRPRRVI